MGFKNFNDSRELAEMAATLTWEEADKVQADLNDDVQLAYQTKDARAINKTFAKRELFHVLRAGIVPTEKMVKMADTGEI